MVGAICEFCSATMEVNTRDAACCYSGLRNVEGRCHPAGSGEFENDGGIEQDHYSLTCCEKSGGRRSGALPRGGMSSSKPCFGPNRRSARSTMCSSCG